VIVDPAYSPKIPKPEEEELDMLDLAAGLTDTCVRLCLSVIECAGAGAAIRRAHVNKMIYATFCVRLWPACGEG
jgi:hypothetical protein